MNVNGSINLIGPFSIEEDCIIGADCTNDRENSATTYRRVPNNIPLIPSGLEPRPTYYL